MIEVDSSREFDGAAVIGYAIDSEEILGTAVVTRRVTQGGRQRLNLAHELGHIVLDVTKSLDVAKGIDEEKMAAHYEQDTTCEDLHVGDFLDS